MSPSRAAVPVLGLAVIVIAATSMVLTLSRGAPRSELEVAHAYACGYRNGQIAITSRLPSLFTNEEDKADAVTCPEMIKLAAKHGFTTK